MPSKPPPFAMDATQQFQCIRCGMCCRMPGYVYVTDADVTRWAAFESVEEEEIIAKWCRLAPNRSQLCLKTDRDGACMFLTAEGCSIYEVRPDQCRNYPFEWMYPHPCPGFGESGKPSA